VLFVNLLRGLRQRSKVCPLGEGQTQGDAGHFTQQLPPGSAMFARVSHLEIVCFKPFIGDNGIE
jgi:hypothetical protein